MTPGMNAVGTLCFVSLILVSPAVAQEADKIANFVHGTLDARSKEIIATTNDMPADKFGFRPAPEDMTFAQLTLHVADTNYLYCSKIGAVEAPSMPAVADTDPKSKLVDRLRDSFGFCAEALSRIATLNKSETIAIGETKTSRAMAILTLTGTWADHSAMQARYVPANVPGPATASK